MKVTLIAITRLSKLSPTPEHAAQAIADAELLVMVTVADNFIKNTERNN